MLSVLFTSCTKTRFNDFNAYKTAIFSKESGLIKEKTVNGIKMTIKYLPADYLIREDMVKNNIIADKKNTDSLRSSYSKSYYFLFSIRQTDNGSKKDLLTRDIFNEQDYLAKKYILEFRMNEFFRLKISDQVYAPVLVHTENHDEFRDIINIHLLFPIENGNKDEVTIVYDDPFWNLGKNNFLFETANFTKYTLNY